MIELRVKIHVIPWDDPEFHEAVGDAWDHLQEGHVPLEARDAAVIAESDLHESGYPEARIEYERTADEVMHGTAHWTIHRDSDH